MESLRDVPMEEAARVQNQAKGYEEDSKKETQKEVQGHEEMDGTGVQDYQWESQDGKQEVESSENWQGVSSF